METRDIVGLPLSIFTDSVMNISYVRILTKTSLESVKIPKSIESYKQNYLLESKYLLEIELVKTRKNWILKEITNSATLFKLNEYSDFLKHRDVVSMLLKYIHEDQEVHILPYVVNTFYQKNMTDVNMAVFESGLLSRLGFAEKNTTKTISEIKQENDIT